MKKRKWNLFMYVIVGVLILCGAMKPVTAKADTIQGAVNYTVGTTQSGALTENGSELNYYKFTLKESGKIQLTGQMNIENVYLHLYNEEGNKEWSIHPWWNGTTNLIALNEDMYLTAGTYYFCVERDWHYYGTYNFKMTFTSSQESFPEGNGGSNNTLAEADTVKTDGTNYHAQLALNDDKDFFRFELKESGKVNYKATFYNMERVRRCLYDENGEELLNDTYYYNETTKNIVLNEDMYLTAGTYYICVSEYYDDDEYRGKYDFQLRFTSSKERYAEKNGGSNNLTGQASLLKPNEKCKGMLAINDRVDFYKINLPVSTTYTFNIESEMDHLTWKLYNAAGSEQKEKDIFKNSVTNRISYKEDFTLEKGTYYIALLPYYSSDWGGNYTISVNCPVRLLCNHKNNTSKWYSATYFDRGYRKYTCKTCGYTWKANYKPVMKLKKTSWKGYKAGSGKLTLKWKTVPAASGYQIKYSTDKNMKKGVVTKRIGGSKIHGDITKLARRKTYYAMVRAYKKSDTKEVWGPWSNKRSFKTK